MDLLNFFNKFGEYRKLHFVAFFNPIFFKTMNQNNDKITRRDFVGKIP